MCGPAQTIFSEKQLIRVFQRSLSAGTPAALLRDTFLASLVVKMQAYRTLFGRCSSQNVGLHKIQARYLNITSVFKRISHRITITKLQRNSRNPTISAHQILYFTNVGPKNRRKWMFVNIKRYGINPLIFFEQFERLLIVNIKQQPTTF